MARPITFLSDYGLSDPFAGTCRAVIARIAPDVQVIDISHGVARHDIRHGAAMLVKALPYAPAGVHLAVVDPGVGSERRAIAVRVEHEDRVLVGPDNGLLAPAIERLGGAVEAVEISRSPVRLEPVSATFHGRDIFAPVAAHVAAGMSLAAVGDSVDPAEVVSLPGPAPVVEPGARLRAAVGYVDGYGNATLMASAEAAGEAGLRPGAEIAIEVGGTEHRALYAVTFADVAEGDLMLYLDATASLALAVNRGSAADRLGLAAGDQLTLRPV